MHDLVSCQCWFYVFIKYVSPSLLLQDAWQQVLSHPEHVGQSKAQLLAELAGLLQGSPNLALYLPAASLLSSPAASGFLPASAPHPPSFSLARHAVLQPAASLSAQLPPGSYPSPMQSFVTSGMQLLPVCELLTRSPCTSLQPRPSFHPASTQPPASLPLASSQLSLTIQGPGCKQWAACALRGLQTGLLQLQPLLASRNSLCLLQPVQGQIRPLGQGLIRLFGGPDLGVVSHLLLIITTSAQVGALNPRY